jgi:hypothetical protein
MDGFAWTCDDVICESQQFITGQLCGCSTLSLGESRSWLFRPSRVVALPFSSSPQVPSAGKRQPQLLQSSSCYSRGNSHSDFEYILRFRVNGIGHYSHLVPISSYQLLRATLRLFVKAAAVKGGGEGHETILCRYWLYSRFSTNKSRLIFV